MRRLISAVFFAGLGGALVYVAFMYHVVHADEGFLLIPKHKAALTDAYVDVRGWTASQWKDHALLARSVAGHGRSDLIVGTATNSFLREIMDAFRPARASRPASPEK